MKKNTDSLGDLIKEARLKKDWTLKILSQQMKNEVSASYLSEVEHDMEVPSHKFLCIISKLLELDLTTLMDKAKEAKLEEYKKLLNRKYKKNCK